MNILSILVQLISGAMGGNLVGSGFKNFNFTALGSSLTGLVGGGLFGQLLHSLTRMGGSGGGSDTQIFLTSLAGGVSGGAIMTAIVGWIKSILSKSP